MHQQDFQQTKKDSLIYNIEEAKSNFNMLGAILLIAFIGLLSSSEFTIPTYSIGTWGILLISYKYWPSPLKKTSHFIFYFLILASFSLFFSYISLYHFSWNWEYITSLICLIIIVSFLNWIVFLGMVILSFSVSFLITYCCYPSDFSDLFPTHLEILINSIAPIISVIIIWRHKTQIKTQTNKQISEISSSNDDLARQTRIRIAELETALVSKTDFLNNMSHEIRTPIQGFTTLSEGLVAHWQSFSEEKRLDLASQVSNNARRLASLVTNLLDFSKFTADKMIMDFQSFNLNDAIKEIIEECRELYLNDKQIEIKFINCKNDSVYADRNRIEQVLRNLFVNAIKFSSNNSSIEATLKYSKINESDCLHFTISDTGPGIPDTEIDSIFDPFIQSSRTRSKGGTGLGLSISKKIIDAHNGKIWAENNSASGAKFHFIIPITQAKNDLFSNKQYNTTILMIDDEDICLSSMELILTNTSYTLIKANCGEKALEYLKNHPNSVDLIFLDLMMPDIYGLNILENIKKDASLKQIPVILQSGTSDKAEIHKAYSMGIFSYISKPYKRNIILAEIDKAINYYAENNHPDSST